MARIELWNGDICDLEVDAIVNAANLSLWMSTGVGGALKRAGGDAIEFAAVRQAPVPLGEAIVTPAGKLAAKAVIHAVSLDRERRTSGPVIEAAVRSAMARAREIGATSIAFPALGTGVGGFPLDEAARITVETVRDELAASPTIEHVIFALRGAAAYQAFSAELHPAGEPTGRRTGMSTSVRGRRGAARRARRAGRPRDPAARPDRSGGPLPRGQPAVPGARRQRDALLRSRSCAACSAATSPPPARSWPTTPASSC